MGQVKQQCECRICGEGMDPRRYALGPRYQICLLCGEEAATTERMGWCVVQEYGKGPYQLVTPTAAPVTLKQTNQKDPRV